MLRNPALVVVLSCGEAAADGFGPRQVRVGVTVGEGLAAFFTRPGTGTLGLRKESLNPGLVDKVEGAGRGSREEEVEEDANDFIELSLAMAWAFSSRCEEVGTVVMHKIRKLPILRTPEREGINAHLGVKETGSWFDDRSSGVMHGALVEVAL